MSLRTEVRTAPLHCVSNLGQLHTYLGPLPHHCLPRNHEQPRAWCLSIQDPEDLVEIMQFKEFEKIGVQGHFGVSQLKHVQKQFGKDAEVMGIFMTLVNAYVL